MANMIVSGRYTPEKRMTRWKVEMEGEKIILRAGYECDGDVIPQIHT